MSLDIQIHFVYLCAWVLCVHETVTDLHFYVFYIGNLVSFGQHLLIHYFLWEM